MPEPIREVWATYDTMAGGRLVGVHLTKMSAKREAGVVADEMDFVKLPILTDEAAAVLAAAVAAMPALNDVAHDAAQYGGQIHDSLFVLIDAARAYTATVTP